MPTVLGAVQIRLYRVRWFFEHLEYNLTLSLLWVTLVRNLVVRIPPQNNHRVCCVPAAAGLSSNQVNPVPALVTQP